MADGVCAVGKGAQERPAPVAPASIFTFRESFWLNLHHYLYVLGRAQAGTPDRTRRAVAGAPREISALDQATAADRQTWREAIGFYQSGLSKLDAVFDADLLRVTQALGSVADDGRPSRTGLDAQLVETLERAAPIYRSIWWARHHRANLARVVEFRELLGRHGARIRDRLTRVYAEVWPAAGYRIDIVAYANWAGAYSTDRMGGLIVMSSLDPGTDGVFGLETLFHEASHQWDVAMEARIAAASKALGAKPPPTLLHALVFYTAGEVTRAVIPDHRPYAEANGLWNGSLGAAKSALDTYWRPYVLSGGTLDDALRSVIRASGGRPTTPLIPKWDTIRRNE